MIGIDKRKFVQDKSENLEEKFGRKYMYKSSEISKEDEMTSRKNEEEEENLIQKPRR